LHHIVAAMLENIFPKLVKQQFIQCIMSRRYMNTAEGIEWYEKLTNTVNGQGMFARLAVYGVVWSAGTHTAVYVCAEVHGCMDVPDAWPVCVGTREQFERLVKAVCVDLRVLGFDIKKLREPKVAGRGREVCPSSCLHS
jgi:hypothetical protein